MKRALVAIVVCGCNRIFGVGTTAVDLADARYFDAPLDASPACPSIGTSPIFKDTLHQVNTKLCNDYAPAEDGSFAMALCNDTVVSAGPAGGPLAPVALDVVSGTANSARLSPEGDLALVESYVLTPTTVQTIDVYTRGATPETWTHVGALPVTSPSFMFVSTPSRGPSRHVFVIVFNTQVTELVGDGGSWTVVDNYNLLSIGANAIDTPALTPDGLRMVWRGIDGSQTGIAYTDRQDVGTRFAAATLLDVPDVSTPYLTEDCNRLYFSAVETTLYFQQ